MKIEHTYILEYAFIRTDDKRMFRKLIESDSIPDWQEQMDWGEWEYLDKDDCEEVEKNVSGMG